MEWLCSSEFMKILTVIIVRLLVTFGANTKMLSMSC